MSEKNYAELTPNFSSYEEIIDSIHNEKLLETLKKHNVNLTKEIGKITGSININGDKLAILMPSPIIPSKERINEAKNNFGRSGGVMAFYPEYIFADDYGLGFLVRYRVNNDYDFYAIVVKEYEDNNYIKLFSNQHNMPIDALKEYVDRLDFTNLSKLDFYKDQSLTWQSVCLCTDNINHKGDIYVQEISQKEMNDSKAKINILNSIRSRLVARGYNIAALYSNGGQILHREDANGNPFDAFLLNIEYYDLNNKKISEEHYSFAYAQELVPYIVNGKELKDKKGRTYYDIKKIPDAKGRNSAMSLTEAQNIFFRDLAPSPDYAKFLTVQDSEMSLSN